ncbi:hypothetical protein BGZ63DRAFT_369964 [Mariannaea sp. PMI_226]|nr:hypothetical protein BGZ63DRAFT_369964 [Mariannaea sp. PMI_226]
MEPGCWFSLCSLGALVAAGVKGPSSFCFGFILLFGAYYYTLRITLKTCTCATSLSHQHLPVTQQQHMRIRIH